MRLLGRECGLEGLAMVAVSALTAIPPNATNAQIVTPRTVPVQQVGQFEIFPSRLSGMAGTSIALDDTLLDPFANPAKAVRLSGVLAFSIPGVHTISSGGGHGRTFPVGLFASHGRWAGGGLVAGQLLDHTPRGRPTAIEETTTNRYLSALLARRLGNGLSLGASGYWANLDGMDGMDLLYAGSTRLEMSAKQLDLRAGLLKEWGTNRTFELLLVHARSDASHDVEFPVPSWDPTTRTFKDVPRYDHNDDRTRIWGVHSEMTIPIDSLGTRVGWLVTANRLTHPKIPNYPIVNLPRDPGGTYAFNVGVGLGEALGATSTGMDLIFEPMWSHTWADAASDITTDAGRVIPSGGKTVENWFRFSNFKVRGGVAHEFRNEVDSTVRVRIQLGFAVYVNRYGLRQRDNVQGSERHQSVSWTEWGPTLGVGFRARLLEVAYSLEVTCAPESCRLGAGDDVTVSAPTPGTGTVIAPVTNPSSGLGYGRTLTHRLTITIPKR